MAQQTINIGDSYNDPDSDKGRDGFDKCNDNFDELYQAVSDNSDLISGLSDDITDLEGQVGAFVNVAVALPVWDMDTDATKAVAWTLPANKSIRNISVMIYQDGSTSITYPINHFDGTYVCGSVYYDGTNFQLARTASSAFDGANFNATASSRGWIYITYDAVTPA